jgi:hypothetical protein
LPEVLVSAASGRGDKYSMTDLHYQSLIVPQDPDQYVVLDIAPPGSAAAASLAELATRSEPASFRTSA